MQTCSTPATSIVAPTVKTLGSGSSCHLHADGVERRQTDRLLHGGTVGDEAAVVRLRLPAPDFPHRAVGKRRRDHYEETEFSEPGQDLERVPRITHGLPVDRPELVLVEVLAVDVDRPRHAQAFFVVEIDGEFPLVVEDLPFLVVAGDEVFPLHHLFGEQDLDPAPFQLGIAMRRAGPSLLAGVLSLEFPGAGVAWFRPEAARIELAPAERDRHIVDRRSTIGASAGPFHHGVAHAASTISRLASTAGGRSRMPWAPRKAIGFTALMSSRIHA